DSIAKADIMQLASLQVKNPATGKMLKPVSFEMVLSHKGMVVKSTCYGAHITNEAAINKIAPKMASGDLVFLDSLKFAEMVYNQQVVFIVKE
ncbi:MAG TPA: hypothetical protein VG603_05595, partial [Chitinophagales bacterium]|nr:hypothetical protein [Chitinophagales bacterium]